METFLTTAVILGLTAGFAYCNQRFLHLQQTIGLMLLALGFTLMLALLKVLGLSSMFASLQGKGCSQQPFCISSIHGGRCRR